MTACKPPKFYMPIKSSHIHSHHCYRRLQLPALACVPECALHRREQDHPVERRTILRPLKCALKSFLWGKNPRDSDAWRHVLRPGRKPPRRGRHVALQVFVLDGASSAAVFLTSSAAKEKGTVPFLST